MRNLQWFLKRFLLFCFVIQLIACRNVNESPKADEGSPVKVYGPYKVIPLSITNGVSVTNPIQLATGPGGKIFGANQDGKIYF